METKLLNLILYRQTLLQKHLYGQLKEIQLQLQIQKSFLNELKGATDYFKSEFRKNELAGFPLEITAEVNTEVNAEVNTEVNTEVNIKGWKGKYLKNSYQNTIFEGRNPAECLE